MIRPGCSIRSDDNRARVLFAPTTCPQLPYLTFCMGTAGMQFPTRDNAVAYLTRKGHVFTVADLYQMPVRTPEHGAAFLDQLIREGREFHPDDPPATILAGGSHSPLFNAAEARHVNRRMRECFALNKDLPVNDDGDLPVFDPYAYLIDRSPEYQP